MMHGPINIRLEKIVRYSICTSILKILLKYNCEHTVCSPVQGDHNLLNMMQKGKNI